MLVATKSGIIILNGALILPQLEICMASYFQNVFVSRVQTQGLVAIRQSVLRASYTGQKAAAAAEQSNHVYSGKAHGTSKVGKRPVYLSCVEVHQSAGQIGGIIQWLDLHSRVEIGQRQITLAFRNPGART